MTAIPKPEPRKREKARRRRRERATVEVVRGQVADRDHYCRLYRLNDGTRALMRQLFGACSGQSEWAHFGPRKRARTRNMPPEHRHDRRFSLMLCAGHHDAYDEGRLGIEALTERACDGPLRFTNKLGEYCEEPDNAVTERA